eukprot:6197091-Pleurochrysis_carterae.AAC.4
MHVGQVVRLALCTSIHIFRAAFSPAPQVAGEHRRQICAAAGHRPRSKDERGLADADVALCVLVREQPLQSAVLWREPELVGVDHAGPADATLLRLAASRASGELRVATKTARSR